MLVERARPAMGSLFTVRLLGDDVEHLATVAEAALDEIERVERLLSWRDVRSECSRINREAKAGPVLVDYELAAVLQTCDDARRATGGYFDVAASAGLGVRSAELGARSAERGEAAGQAKFVLDGERRLIRFMSPHVRLDFGAFGKGYALDRAADELRRYGVTRGLLDGGTSSVLALGDGPDGSPWRVGLRNPFDAEAAEVRQLRLCDAAISCSAVFDFGAATSDVVDPLTGRPLAEPAACAVAANSAATAEILSTALLCMGKARATAYSKQTSNVWLDATSIVVWLALHDGGVTAETLLERTSSDIS